MDHDIFELFLTFGTQYGRDPERHEIHPLGMTGNGYMVVEAPTYELARKIAFAVTDGQFAFDYDRETFMEGKKHLDYYPEGELLRLAWQPTVVAVGSSGERLREPATGQSGEW